MLLVLDGTAHAFVFAKAGMYLQWDRCGPQGVLTAAGGTVTDILGRPLLYHSHVPQTLLTGLLATGPGVTHDCYLQRIPQDVRDHFTG